MAFFVKQVSDEQEVNKSDRYTFEVDLKRQSYFNKKLKSNAWHYYVEGVFRAQTVNIDIVPGGKDDRGGYGLLDLIFGFYGGNSVPLYAIDYSYTNKDGEKVEGTNFELYYDDVQNFDEYVCPVRASRQSDSELLNTLLKRYKRKLEAQLAASADPVTGEVLDNPPVEKPEKKNKS